MLEKGVTGEEVVTEGQRDVEVKTVNLERAQGLEVGDVGVHLVAMGGVVGTVLVDAGGVVEAGEVFLAVGVEVGEDDEMIMGSILSEM